jgi:hypothetical protein
LWNNIIITILLLHYITLQYYYITSLLDFFHVKCYNIKSALKNWYEKRHNHTRPINMLLKLKLQLIFFHCSGFVYVDLIIFSTANDTWNTVSLDYWNSQLLTKLLVGHWIKTTRNNWITNSLESRCCARV